MPTYTAKTFRSTLLDVLACSGPRYGATHTGADICRQLTDSVLSLFGGDGVFNAGGLDLNWDQCWCVEADLSVRFTVETFQRPTTSSRGPGEDTHLRVQTSIRWSSTGRDLPTARAAAKLYAEVVDLAALIEAAFDNAQLDLSATGDDEPSS